MKTKILFFVLTLAFAGIQLSYAQAQQSALDGRKYKIDFMKDGKTESVETLIFNNATLETPDCAKYGFTSGKAYVKQTQDYYTWSATLKSEKEGVMGWQGSVKGETIEGTCMWRKEGQQSISYTFKGTAVKEEAPAQK